MTTLENAVAVVTGAGRGIGRAIAEELGRGGARVVVNYSRSKGPAEELIEQLMEQGSPQAVAIQADVADAAQAARLIQETAQQYFLQQNSGKIINISSFVGQAGNFGQANYAAAKSGIIGFTKTAALELARNNVTVNAVCPGFIETEMFAHIPEKAREAILKRIPLGRTGTPQEVARSVRYLIVDGDYITGQTLNINGGIYM